MKELALISTYVYVCARLVMTVSYVCFVVLYYRKVTTKPVDSRIKLVDEREDRTKVLWTQ